MSISDSDYAVVLNQEDGSKRRFSSLQEANDWCKKKNRKLNEKGKASRFVAYLPDNLPAWAKE